MIELITELEKVKQLGAAQHNDFEVMRYMLERNDDVTDEIIDAIVEKIAAPIVEAIDCTKCANCCLSLDVYLDESDVERLSGAIDIPVNEITTRYVDREAAAEIDEWGKFKTSPCVFLNGKLCSVYAHRPESCRVYPVFTPDFRWMLEDMNEGAKLCPIIYNVLTVMVEVANKL